MPFANPNAPNLPDFLLFVQNSMQIPPAALPAGSEWPGYALNQAINLALNIPTIAGSDYTLAVYNCAGHILLRITPDQPGQTYFSAALKSFNMLGPVSGAVQSSSDQGTSSSFAVPEGIQNLTIGDLNFFCTPWGRAYLAYAQDFGSVWGLT